MSLELWSGEVVALVGDNGAGKTTFVKILSGLLQPDAGELWVGAELTGLSAHRARASGIETVYQNLALCEHLGAAANVMLGQEPTRVRVGPIRIIDERRSLGEARRLIAEIGITLDDFTAPVRRLSGGQRQAVALARALVRGHRLIMLDEPTAALGVRQTKSTLELIRRVAAQGVAVLMISHNLDDVFVIADRIVALRLGRVVLNTRRVDSSREQVVAYMTGTSLGETG